jgi:hypothetical protein
MILSAMKEVGAVILSLIVLVVFAIMAWPLLMRFALWWYDHFGPKD